MIAAIYARKRQDERTVSPVWQNPGGEGGKLLAVHVAI
jgi:hypothetical protein